MKPLKVFIALALLTSCGSDTDDPVIETDSPVIDLKISHTIIDIEEGRYICFRDWDKSGYAGGLGLSCLELSE